MSELVSTLPVHPPNRVTHIPCSALRHPWVHGTGGAGREALQLHCEYVVTVVLSASLTCLCVCVCVCMRVCVRAYHVHLLHVCLARLVSCDAGLSLIHI